MAKTGRPKVKNPKQKQLCVRLDSETLRKLDACAIANKETRVQALRRGIEIMFLDLEWRG